MKSNVKEIILLTLFVIGLFALMIAIMFLTYNAQY
jgi:hypothetical protein